MFALPDQPYPFTCFGFFLSPIVFIDQTCPKSGPGPIMAQGKNLCGLPLKRLKSLFMALTAAAFSETDYSEIKPV